MDKNQINLEKFQEEQEKTNRRLDSMQKSVDLVMADRDILENIQGRLTSIEERMTLSRQHDDIVRKDIKEEIQISGDQVTAKVETKVEEIKEIVKKKRKFNENPLKISIFSSFFNKLRGGGI